MHTFCTRSRQESYFNIAVTFNERITAHQLQNDYKKRADQACACEMPQADVASLTKY